MTLTDLLAGLRAHVAATAHLHLDSRQLQAGDVFLAAPGVTGDGRRYIEAALAAGAAAVVYESDNGTIATRLAQAGVAAFAVTGLRAQLGELADAWYGQPSQALRVVAITGTNGKTSCAEWLAQLLARAGRPCGVMGTLGAGMAGGERIDTGLTTPDVVQVHRWLAACRDAGAWAAVMEASSIGLEQGRMDGVRVQVAAFTNLTRDHLDIHPDMAAYEAAKARLLRWPGLQTAVVHVADAAGQRMARLSTAQAVWPVATTAARAGGLVPFCTAEATPAADGGQAVVLTWQDAAQTRATLPVPGAHAVENLLVVAGVLRALDPALVADDLGRVPSVPGRLERIVATDDAAEEALLPAVFVDYAHTPDALEKALAALRPVAQQRGGRLWCVFGCGGDRDPGKRPQMGAVVAAAADVPVLTSDNPRSEDPLAILAAIRAGLPAELPAYEIADRALAILHAILHAAPADVVLVAGKGHEAEQEIAGLTLPFQDTQWSGAGLSLRLASQVVVDSRLVTPGAVFVALAGQRSDGHDHLDAAQAAGARAAIVARAVPTASLPCWNLGNTQTALGLLGQAWRAHLAAPAIAVTGSNGKTTTKGMIASVLEAWHGPQAVLATRGNFNNDIGVPLTLLRWRPEHQVGVIELGMNHPGEIAGLAAMAAATVALVNNAQREHQEHLGSVAATAHENGRVIAALPADGVAVYPADDACAPIWDALAGSRRRLRFALAGDAEVRVRDVRLDALGSEAVLITPQGEIALRLPLAGEHNLRNALAAAACALALGCPLPAIAAGLAGFAGAPGRLQATRLDDGLLLIDDTYNANPDSVRAAIDVLASQPAPRVLVLGDMGEVGADSPALHAEVGAYARERGIESLIVLGTAVAATAQAFGTAAVVAAAPLDAARLVRAQAPAAVLVKGSRFMRMEQVVEAVRLSAQQTTSTGASDAA